MAIYKFDWSLFVTGSLLHDIRSMAEMDAHESIDEIKPLIARILSATGGLPLTRKQYSEDERTEIAKTLLHEGVKHVIHFISPRGETLSGYMLKESSIQEFENIIQHSEKISINSAGFDALVDLPEIGPAIARRIISQRTANGSFVSLDDLEERVHGLGKKKVEKISPIIIIDNPVQPTLNRPVITGDFSEDLSSLMAAHKGLSKLGRLISTLDLMATLCSSEVHPYTKNGFIRDFHSPENNSEIDAEWIGTLFGYEYFKCVPELMANANSRILVCMFHIAYPSQGHPTKNFLEALKAAHDRGVNVRVLLDRDRPDDPYLSTLINSNAKEYLEEIGIDCKFDREERLLHSKYILIDDDLVILGSHNWSAGSYFQFDDLSFAVKSMEFANQLDSRFEQLWNGS